MIADAVTGALCCQFCGVRTNPWEGQEPSEHLVSRLSERESWRQRRRQVTGFLVVCASLLAVGLALFLMRPSSSGSPGRQLKNLIFGRHLTEVVEQTLRPASPAAPHQTGRPDGNRLQPPPPNAGREESSGGLPQAPGQGDDVGRAAGGERPGRSSSDGETTADTGGDEMARRPAEPGRGGPPPRQDGRANPLAQVKASGSGFFITTDGCLLTSQHVVAHANRVVIATKTGRFPVRVLAGDANNDLALLKAAVQSKPLPLANSRITALGETVFTIGFPVPAIQGLEPKLTDGKISSLAGAQDDPRFFQTSVAVQPGNSGGPLVDQAGNAVGIVTMRLDDLKTWKLTGSLPQNVNYALKSSVIISFLENRPEARANRRTPSLSRERRFEEVVREAQEAVVLVLVY